MSDQSTTDIDVPVPIAEQVVFQHLTHIFNQAAIAIPGGLATLGRHWTHYYPRVAFGEQGVILPASTLTFIINALLVFIEIKSQGQPGFPFHSHPLTVMFSVTSLLIYGLASAAELVFFAGGLDATSVYVIIARFGRICGLCILVASLSSLVYV